MDSGRRWLGAAYVYPAVLLVLVGVSAYQAYLPQIDASLCSPNSSVACLDRVPFFVFETVVFAAAALLAYRAVSGTRKAKKDLWTVRVYWPSILAAFALLALAGHGVVSFPTRGCDAGPAYVGYACWDPGASLVRVAVVALATAAFMLVVTMVPEWVGGAGSGGAKKPKARPEDAAPEKVEEIAPR